MPRCAPGRGAAGDGAKGSTGKPVGTDEEAGEALGRYGRGSAPLPGAWKEGPAADAGGVPLPKRGWKPGCCLPRPRPLSALPGVKKPGVLPLPLAPPREPLAPLPLPPRPGVDACSPEEGARPPPRPPLEGVPLPRRPRSMIDRGLMSDLAQRAEECISDVTSAACRRRDRPEQQLGSLLYSRVYGGAARWRVQANGFAKTRAALHSLPLHAGAIAPQRT
jgi:hypothetical protein